MRRVMTAAMVTVTATALGTGQAATAQAAQVTAGVASAVQATAKLPRGFLLNEAKLNGPRRPWEHLKLSNSLKKPLEVNPCGRRTARDGRSASRTFTYLAETVYRSEQVVLYPSARAAKAAMRSVRADLAECGSGAAATNATHTAGRAPGSATRPSGSAASSSRTVPARSSSAKAARSRSTSGPAWSPRAFRSPSSAR